MIDILDSNSYNHFSKHFVAVDCVIFGYEEDNLKLLLYPRGFEPSQGKWSLMGGFVRDNESMDQAARRVLNFTVGLDNIYLEQVRSFSDPERDPGGRVISMAYFALIRIDQYDKELVRNHGAHWWPITKLPPLIFDHANMIENALERLQRKASLELVGKELLPEMFTLTQLHNLYNAIFQKQFDAGNFRKKLSSLNLLDRLPEKDTSNSKRGAYYYKFKYKTSTDNIDRIVKL
ncbi:MAG: NUDIX hydrolase [Bacteroidales bacterium]|nr:NUDIX hydrolase [Bacteroidales bacterium]MBN2818688.1 NUDIX hydrolase [Bacteroidales bacterium]